MIRPLGTADRGAVMALLHSTGSFSDAELAIAEELIGLVLDHPGQPDYHAFVATAPGDTPNLAGFLLLGPTPATSGTWDIYWIAVHRQLQGTGVGRQLDAFAEEFVRGRRGYWMIAETSGRSDYAGTRAFYERRGYAVLARIPDYYRPLDDLVIFGKRLDSPLAVP